MAKQTVVISIFILSMFLLGCSTTNYKTYEPPELEFKKFEKMNIDMESFVKIPPPDIMLAKLDEDGKIIFLDDNSELEATHVIMSASELSKIEALIDRNLTYKTIIEKTTEVTDYQTDMINRYLEYLVMEREMTRQYHFMWKDTRDAYLKERRDHRIDNLLNRATLVVTVIGGVAIAAL